MKSTSSTGSTLGRYRGRALFVAVAALTTLFLIGLLVRSEATHGRSRPHDVTAHPAVLPGPSTVAPAPGRAADKAGALTQATRFTITGRGWGHGIGMSQWGAYGLARHGRSYKAILKHYYARIGFARIANRNVRVLLRGGLKSARVTCASEYRAEGLGGGMFVIPGGTPATVRWVGDKYRVVAGGRSRRFNGPVTFTSARSVLRTLTPTDLNRAGAFRGRIRVVRSGSSLRMVNVLAMESYLRGVVPYEMPATWHMEALKAQSCAARAYAERARRAATGQFDLYTDTRSQVYGGVAAEASRTDRALRATAGVVPTYGGRPIQAFYFSSSGGRTENIEFAWQTSPQPYLKGVKDPYDGASPLHTWGPVRRSTARFESGLGAAVKGSLRAIVTVKRGTSPRIVKAAVIGSDGVSYVHGSKLRTAGGLNSTWASIRSVSISPAAADGVTVSPGARVELAGRIYPALADGAAVKLARRAGGSWRTTTVTTRRRTQHLPDGYKATYSTYRVGVRVDRTTSFELRSGAASSPVTVIKVGG